MAIQLKKATAAKAVETQGQGSSFKTTSPICRADWFKGKACGWK